MHAFFVFCFYFVVFVESVQCSTYLFLVVDWTRKLVGYLLYSIYARVHYYMLCISWEDERKILPGFLYYLVSSITPPGI